MSALFSYHHILKTYTDLKTRKSADRGKSLPTGVDGMRTDVFERNLQHSIGEIERKLNSKTPSGHIAYSFGPLLRIERKKASGGIRYLHVPRLRDQIVLRIIHDEIINAASKNGISLNLKSPYSLVNEFNEVVKQYRDPWIVKADITGFYDTIPRNTAIRFCENIGMDKEVFLLLKQWGDTLNIKEGYLASSRNESSGIGLPQGLSISSSLAELYAKEIDKAYLHHQGYFRYVDDILILCANKEEANNTLNALKENIKSKGLQLADNKTGVKQMLEGFEWLGMNHFPDRKSISPDKQEQWIRPFLGIKRNCIKQLSACTTEEEKTAVLKHLLKQTEKHMHGNKRSRIRWYSLFEDTGQWKKMDQMIHGFLRACFRKANVGDMPTWKFPSLHAKIHSIKKLKESS